MARSRGQNVILSVSAIKLALTIGGLLVMITASYFGSKMEANAKIAEAREETTTVKNQVDVLAAGLNETARTIAREEVERIGKEMNRRLDEMNQTQREIKESQAKLFDNMQRIERIVNQ